MQGMGPAIRPKYDFSMSSALALADPEDFIYTKMIVISPKYVVVNQMKGALEIAQIHQLLLDTDHLRTPIFLFFLLQYKVYKRAQRAHL